MLTPASSSPIDMYIVRFCLESRIEITVGKILTQFVFSFHIASGEIWPRLFSFSQSDAVLIVVVLPRFVQSYSPPRLHLCLDGLSSTCKGRIESEG
uniref:ARAD1C44968p n=1 Tax=Blastobotrys adeninivorans TaxID=409370 RepID=A0A060T4W6_BLAAD